MKFLAALLLFTLLLTAAHAELIDDTRPVATYDVNEGEIEGLPPDHSKIWEGVRALVAPSLLELVSKFELFNVEEKADQLPTDGYALMNEDFATFTLALNLESARLTFVEPDAETVPEFEKTIVHEEGHILSLQASQFDDTGTVSGTLEVDGSVLLSGAYLNQFYHRFWKKAFPDRSVETVGDVEGAAFYKKSPRSFVSEYAATGPQEDFAESFAWFVTEAKPAGSAVKDLKVKFFYEWPELVTMRTEIRKGLTPVGKKGR